MNEQLKLFLADTPDAYPHHLEARFPRIVEKIVAAWRSPEAAAAVFDDLLVDRRGGRQGFPPEIAREIFNLSVAYEKLRGQREGSADVWGHERDNALAEIEGLGLRVLPSDMLRAAEGGNADRLLLFLRAGMDVDARDAREWTPLMAAAFNGNEEAVKLLIQRGADAWAHDAAGYTPLHWAALKGHQDVVEILAQRGDVNVKSKSGLTPLLQAAAGGHAAVVKFLLAAGADPNVTTVDGWTPLHKAVANGHTAVVRTLLDYGATVFVRHADGTTPMALAAKGKHDEILQMLRDAQAARRE